MKDDELKDAVKGHGDDEGAVRGLLLGLLKAGDVTPEQVLRVLDESEEWPGGWPYDARGGSVICVNPTFAVSVVTEFERLQGNEQAFCC